MYGLRRYWYLPIICLGFALGLLSACGSGSYLSEIGISGNGLTALDSYVDGQVKSGRIHGAVLLMARNGHVAELQSYGLMDVANKVAMRNDTLFRAASISKVASVVGALTLVDSGKLGLDDPVSKYLPEFSASRVLTSPARNPDGSWQTTTATRPITVRDLFRHTAGLQYGFGLNDLDNEYFQFANAWQAPLSDFIGKIAVLPLAYQPGTQFSYSYSIDVLGRVIEVVSGKTLDVFLDEKVFRPLFMVDTAFYAPAGKVGRFSNFYASPDGSLVLKETAAASEFLVRPIGLSAGGGWATGYGGLVTTAPDFGRLLQMLLNKGELEGARILKPGTVDEMIKNQLLGIDRSTFFPPLPGGYGLGIGLEERADAPGKPLIFWGGAPYNTSFFADFRTGQYAIFLTQSGPWDKLYQPGGLHVEFRALALASVIQ